MVYPAPMTRLRALLPTLLALPLACGDKAGDDTGDASSSSTSSSSSSTTGVTDATTSETPTTDAGTSTGSTSSDSSTSGSSGCSSSTGAPVCSLEQTACDVAETNGEFEDCGFVTPWDHDTAAWQAAHDCTVKAVDEERAFKVIIQLQGFDSEIVLAYVSIVGRSYGLNRYSYDSDPCGGRGCGPVLDAAGCEAIVATPGCTVEPGEACLTCVDPGESSRICGPE